MQGPNITLISFGFFDKDFLRKVAGNIAHELKCKVDVREGHLDLSNFYDAARLQYNANDLLNYIEKNLVLNQSKIIGLFSVDLYIPIFTYIFGQAFLGGNSGIASVYRLTNERYGMLADDDLLLLRISKEVIHELGHTLGLIHCHVPDCVMRSGSYVEDIDQKGAGFCIDCRGKIVQLSSAQMY